MADEQIMDAVETPVDSIVNEFSQQNQPGTLGNDAPEPFRGKSINDLFNEVQKLQNTNKINEEVIRRMSAEPPKPQIIQVGQPVPVAPVQQGPNEEELTAMIADDDPKVRMQAWNIMQQRNNTMLAQALERRLEPLAGGAVSAAESAARQKYPLEFELFASEIDQYKSRVPREAFTNPQAWDELMNQVRGQNALRFVTEFQKRSGTRSLESVQAEAAANAGFVPPVRQTGPSGSPGGPSTLDDLQRKVAAEFGMTDQEYIHFTKQGDVL